MRGGEAAAGFAIFLLLLLFALMSPKLFRERLPPGAESFWPGGGLPPPPQPPSGPPPPFWALESDFRRIPPPFAPPERCRAQMAAEARLDYPQRSAAGLPRPWEPAPMPPFVAPWKPDAPLSAMGRDVLGGWWQPHASCGPDDGVVNPLVRLRNALRPEAPTWFRAPAGWADLPGDYEGSSASALSAYMERT